MLMRYPLWKNMEVTIPTGVATYRVDIDTTELEALAYRAAHNKSGKAKDGPLLVTITKRKERFKEGR